MVYFAVLRFVTVQDLPDTVLTKSDRSTLMYI